MIRTHSIIVGVTVFLWMAFSTGAVAEKSPAVDTSSGQVVGLEEDGLLIFRGIPFAEPPVGELRFKAPVPRKRSPETIEAFEFCPACLQEESWKLPSAGVSEDCLSLNIWTSGLSGPPRPVMVYIHGGGYIAGSGADPRSEGKKLVMRGDVVYVTITYRLGLLGFLDMEHISGVEYAGSVNNGIRDQLLALEWVRDNISAFGGDPGRVTVFGNSAGAGSIAGMLGIDHPEQYLQRVIIQSRPILTSHQTAIKVADIYKEQAALMGIAEPDDWVTASTETLFELMRRVEEHVGTLAHDRLHGPTYGPGLLIPEKPAQRLKQGHAKDIDLIIGTTMDETRYYASYDPTLCNRKPMNNELTEGNPLLGIGTAVLARLYKLDLTRAAPDRRHFSNGEAMVAIVDDVFFRIPTVEMADAHSEGGGRTYVYLYDYEANRPDNPCIDGSAPHATEIPFVFGNLDLECNLNRIGKPRDEQDRQTRELLSDMTQDAWVSFAWTGNPNVENTPLVHWPEYDLPKRKTIVIAPESRVVNKPFHIEQSIIKAVGADKMDML